MTLIGVICEYNPFHYGHQKQLEYLHRTFPNATLVSVMSGNFVQRGDGAVLDKYLRAEMAVACGADLVLELPLPYCMGGAAYFATAGIRLLDAIGAEGVCYGCESEPEIIQKTVANLSSPTFLSALAQNKDPSCALAYRKARTYAALYGTPLLQKPNDILALEYEKAIQTEKSPLLTYPLQREGFWSATASRAALQTGDADALEALLPKQVLERLPERKERPCLSHLDGAVLSFFRHIDPQSLRAYAEWTEDSAYRFTKKAQRATGIADLLEQCKNKRYTDARLRRMLWSALIGFTEADLKAPPCYTNLLGANAKGRAALKQIKKQGKIPVLTKPAHILRLPKTAEKAVAIAKRGESWYSLLYTPPHSAEEFLKKGPYLSIDTMEEKEYVSLASKMDS